MSQSTNPTDPETPAAPVVDESVESQVAPPEATSAPDDAAPVEESTIGTGTSMALGCIAGTVLLIFFGLLYLGISTLV